MTTPQIKGIIVLLGLPEPFSTVDVYNKLRKQGGNYWLWNQDAMKEALSEMVKEGTLEISYKSVKKVDGSITETFYNFK